MLWRYIVYDSWSSPAVIRKFIRAQQNMLKDIPESHVYTLLKVNQSTAICLLHFKITCITYYGKLLGSLFSAECFENKHLKNVADIILANCHSFRMYKVPKFIHSSTNNTNILLNARSPDKTTANKKVYDKTHDTPDSRSPYPAVLRQCVKIGILLAVHSSIRDLVTAKIKKMILL